MNNVNALLMILTRAIVIEKIENQKKGLLVVRH